MANMNHKHSALWGRVFGSRTFRSVSDAARNQSLSMSSYIRSELCRVGSVSFDAQDAEVAQLLDECQYWWSEA